MTVRECSSRLKDLREIQRLYNSLYYDSKSALHRCDSLKELAKKARLEEHRLEELMHNNELEDSYEQDI